MHFPTFQGRGWSVTVCHTRLVLPTPSLQHAEGLFPAACDRENTLVSAPTASVLNRLACLREEEVFDEGLSATEGAPPKCTGWSGMGKPMLAGTGYTVREMYDGQSLASPLACGVQAVQRVGGSRRIVHELLKALSHTCIGRLPGTREGHVVSNVSEAALKKAVADELAARSLRLNREEEKDRRDVPAEVRFLDLILRAAGDTEVSSGAFSRGVTVGLGARPFRLPWCAQTRCREVCQSREIPSTTLKTNSRKTLLGNRTAPQFPHSRPKRARSSTLVDGRRSAKAAPRRGRRQAQWSRDRADLVRWFQRDRRQPKGSDQRPTQGSSRSRPQTSLAGMGEGRRACFCSGVAEAHRQVPIHPRDWHLVGVIK